MKFTKLSPPSAACDDGKTCPAVYLTDRGTLAVQGARVDDADVELHPVEALVEVPITLLRDLSCRLGQLGA